MGIEIQTTLFGEVTTVDGFGKKDESLEVDYVCPRCAYGWSGQPKTEAKATLVPDGPLVFGKPLDDGSASVYVHEGPVVKPPYRIPSMTEIAEIPWNGFNVVSTFSGCGGSSLGYKMAGFKVLWASEFIPAAQDTYRANHPDTILDTRDIRQVEAVDIMNATGLGPGEIDLLDGSPPCSSFSSAGKREAGWGEVKKYSDSEQRTDDLFFEFARILRFLQPKTFVAENVSGLVKGVAKGYFIEILVALKACGYRVNVEVLDAQYLGVPQMRSRAIFVGVREDLKLDPVHPKPLPYVYTVRDALPWIKRVTHPGSNVEKAMDLNADEKPMVCVRTPGCGSNTRYQVEVARPVSVVCYNPTSAFETEPKVYDGPALAIMAGGIGFDKKGRDRSGGDFKSQGDVTDKVCPTITAGRLVADAYRFHVEEQINVVEPETNIERFAIGDEWDKIAPGEQSEKYFSLCKPDLERPCPTVTQTGAVHGAASVVHPTEKRKFSISELKRICSFPDDFILTGTYSQRWERCGRAVPPMMMYYIAKAVLDGVLRKIK